MSLKSRSAAAAVALAVGIVAVLLAATRWELGGSRASEKPVASGKFHQVAHKGAGVATIYRLSDRKLVLRFTEFRTDEGRGLEVLLIAAPDALENETVENSERVSLGPLEKTEGDQSYALPDGVDLSKYRAVTIWSRKHRVNFATAPLAPGSAGARLLRNN